MQSILKPLAAVLVASLITACSGNKTGNDLESKKAELQKLKGEETTLTEKIRKLQEEIAVLDPSGSIKPKLVSVSAISLGNFDHYIDLQGKIGTDNIYQVTPRGQGGQVRAIYVKQGDKVQKGQLLLKLDDALVRQQIEQLNVQLAYAKDLYQRRKNLWDQNIGTEVELINAKNSVNNLEKQLSLLNEQFSFTQVYADASGVAETVNIRVGEIFTGSPANGISIVNSGSLKVVVDVPETYLPRVVKGAPVQVEVPDIGKKFNSSVSLVSQMINNNSRGFTAEAKIPGDPLLKPNQLALVHIRDYAVQNTVVIPLTCIQVDDQGKYVFVMVEEKGKKVARKKPVQAGEINGDQVEIRQGLSEGEKLVTQGFQGLFDGQPVTTEAK